MTEEKVKEASIVEVPTQTIPAFKLEDDSIVDDRGILLRIYNKILNLEREI